MPPSSEQIIGFLQSIQRRLVLIGQKKALGIAVHNDRPQRRYSGLLSRLRFVSYQKSSSGFFQQARNPDQNYRAAHSGASSPNQAATINARTPQPRKRPRNPPRRMATQRQAENTIQFKGLRAEGQTATGVVYGDGKSATPPSPPQNWF